MLKNLMILLIALVMGGASCQGTKLPFTPSSPTSTVPPTSSPVATATATSTPYPVFYTLRVQLSSTSDWTTIYILNSNLVHGMKLVEKRGEITDYVAQKSEIGVYQTIENAKSFKEVSMTLDFQIPADAANKSLPFLLQKGALNTTVLRFYKVEGGVPDFLSQVTRTGDVAGNGATNPFQFSFLLNALLPSPSSNPQAAATEELTLEQRFGSLVPADETVLLQNCSARTFLPGIHCSNSDPEVPVGTLFAELLFRATGESRTEDMSLGRVAMVHLVFRDKEHALQDLWMAYAGYAFGINKDGMNFVNINRDFGGSLWNTNRIGKPDQLLPLLCPGTLIKASVAWQQGAQRSVRSQCYDKYGGGSCNEFKVEAYRSISENRPYLLALSTGDGVQSRDFRLIPLRFTVVPGSPVSSASGIGWEFNTGGDLGMCTDGWNTGNQVDSLRMQDGSLIGQAKGSDPYIFSPAVVGTHLAHHSYNGAESDSTDIFASDHPTVEIRMMVSSGNTRQLFFTTGADREFNEVKSLRFPLAAPGQFATYHLDMSQVKQWSGVVLQLRLDPSDMPGDFEIDYVRLLNAP